MVMQMRRSTGTKSEKQGVIQGLLFYGGRWRTESVKNRNECVRKTRRPALKKTLRSKLSHLRQLLGNLEKWVFDVEGVDIFLDSMRYQPKIKEQYSLLSHSA